MKNIARVLFITTGIASSIHALKDTQKTTLTLRDHRNRPANFTTFHELTSKDASFGSRIQASIFYHETQSGRKLGEVFGANCRNNVVIGTATQVAAGAADVENNLLLHYHLTSNTLEGTLNFNPKQSGYGTNIETEIRLDKLIKGFYFKQNFVFMALKNSVNATFCNEQTGATSTESHRLIDILSGKNLKRNLGGGVDDRYSEQESLRYAKLCGERVVTGLESLESRIGWYFLEKKDHYLGINVALQSPTGYSRSGEDFWEPTLGSRHWGLGCGLEAGATIWDDNKMSLKLLFEFNYRYQFDATEKRTLGIKGLLSPNQCSSHALSHYYLLGKVGKYMLYPAANVLTKDVEVDTKSQIDTFIVLNFNTNGLVLDLGYNLFWKEREKVSLNSCDWTNDTYGIAQFDWQTCNNEFSLAQAQPIDTPVNYCNIDTSVAESPSMLSHSIFAAIGYIFKKWNNPLLLGAGGAYEFGDGRGSPDSFTLWVKGGFSF